MAKKGRQALKTVVGANSNFLEPITQTGGGESRPGEWRSMLVPAVVEKKVHKGRHVPVAVDDAIVEAVANGGKASEIESTFDVRSGYVRSVLLRRFGSVEGMKKALQAQCLENAIALSEHAMSHLDAIPPGQALAGVKLMADTAMILEKGGRASAPTVDFFALAALGETLERVEKQIASENVIEV